MKILVIDNYDSFTYNLVQYLKDFSVGEVVVRRNDEIELEEIEVFDKILISPGPGLPENAGIIKAVIKQYGSSKPILGVCLGMQAIAEVYGGDLINLDEVYHGVASPMNIEKQDALFNNVSNPTEVGRYHSWAMKDENVDDLEVLARSKDDCIMAIRHKEYAVKGVQFHPESVLTPEGKKMIENWINEK
jgi:anthranilate synthase component 2|tara:strand:+ start:378 stop:944 length:567 start_codon:yes stop_codon:yes gene_type:complete